MFIIVNIISFIPLRLLLCVVTFALLSGGLVPSAARAQAVKPSVLVLRELVLPPIDGDGNAFFSLTPPSHLSGSTKGRYRGHFVLTPNTNAYPFVLDASSSTGSNSTPLVFQWSYFIGDESGGDFFPVAGPSTSPYFTNAPPSLSNSITREMILDVSNGSMSDQLWFGIVTLTPQVATDAMIEWINTRYPQLTGRAQRRLLPLLREASAHFAAGETDAAKVSLGLFLKKLKVSRSPLTAHEARVFKALTPKIISTAAD